MADTDWSTTAVLEGGQPASRQPATSGLRASDNVVYTAKDWLATAMLAETDESAVPPHVEAEEDAANTHNSVAALNTATCNADVKQHEWHSPISDEAGVCAVAEAYRADIDGLRAIAVIAVVLFHMDHEWLPGGFVGVDIFFVISGYVVTGSLLRDHDSARVRLGSHLAAFFSRRAKRLGPALAVVMLATALALAACYPPGLRTVDVREYYLTGQLGLVGFANTFLAVRQRGYWEQGEQGAERNPFTHTWSLGVEEQFYGVFPVLVLLAYSRCAARCDCGASALAPTALFAAASLASLALAAQLTTSHSRLAFYLMPSRLWELMSGALLYEWQLRRTSQQQAALAALDGASTPFATDCHCLPPLATATLPPLATKCHRVRPMRHH